MTKKIIFLVASIFIITLLISGCDTNIFEGLADTSSVEYKAFEAQEACNDKDWDEAIRLYEEILANDTDNVEAQKGLAAAYMGRAGLDMASMIAKAENADEYGDDISLYAQMLGDIGSQNLEDISAAIEILEGISNKDNDTWMQLGVAYTVSAILTILDSTGQNPDGTPAGDVAANWDITAANDVYNDLANAVSALNNAGLFDNEVQDSVDEMLADLDPNHDGSISSSEINAYLNL